MIKPVYLLAGGQSPARRRPDPVLTAIFNAAGCAQPRVAYIGAASDDDRGFFSWGKKLLQTAGAGIVELAPMASPRADLEKARRIVATADVLFFSGGDVDLGIRLVRERGLEDDLHRRYRAGALCCGLSAGSIMLARQWVRWRIPDDANSAELFPCLGWAPVLCDTHGESDGWEELIALLELTAKREQDAIGFGIPASCALRVTSTGRTTALGGAVHRFKWSRGGIKRIDDLL